MKNKRTHDLKVEFLPKDVNMPVFQQRESGVSHTPYSREVEFYTCIKNGDIDGIYAQMESFLGDTLVVGRISNDNLQQTKYWAVSCITLATRYAIQGGLTESEAYNLSDKYIQSVDNMQTQEEINSFLCNKAFELTLLVNAHKERLAYPKRVKVALKYIDTHLHEPINSSDVAKECGISVNYLTKMFVKYLGITVAKFIMREKLEASKELLVGDFEYSEIGYYFGFCSQSHYISCFKKQFGITPKDYANRYGEI